MAIKEFFKKLFRKVPVLQYPVIAGVYLVQTPIILFRQFNNYIRNDSKESKKSWSEIRTEIHAKVNKFTLDTFDFYATIAAKKAAAEAEKAAAEAEKAAAEAEKAAAREAAEAAAREAELAAKARKAEALKAAAREAELEQAELEQAELEQAPLEQAALEQAEKSQKSPHDHAAHNGFPCSEIMRKTAEQILCVSSNSEDSKNWWVKSLQNQPPLPIVLSEPTEKMLADELSSALQMRLIRYCSP